MKKNLLIIFLTFSMFSIGIGQIVFTEINFNTYGTDDSDYLELYNNSGGDINMIGYNFSQGFEYTFPDIIFPADSYMVLTVNAKSLMETYGVEGIQWTSGSLGNGEDILLQDPNGVEIDFVLYDNETGGWPTFVDGLGYALQLCDINSDNELPSNWQVTNEKIRDIGSRSLYGTPGQANTCVDGPLITTTRKISRIIENETIDTGTFVFYLENSNGALSSVNLSIDPSSTASPEDYNIINTDIVFDGLQDSFILVTISAVNDDLPESQENIIINIEAGENVTKSVVDQIEFIIYDNDRPLDKGLVLIGVFDADDTDDFDNYGVELFAIKDIPDLSKYSVGMANNGGGTDGIEIPLPPISLNKRDNFFISDSEARFADFFRIDSDLAHPASFITGDDAVELFEDGVVIDIYGFIDIDGTDTPWEYRNGWAKRVPDTGPDGSEFQINNWFSTGVDFLVGPTNDDCLQPYLFEFYFYTSTEDIAEDNRLQLSPTIVEDQLSIKFSTAVNSGSIFITNNQGVVESNIQIAPGTQNIDIRTNHLSAGLYYLTLKSENGIKTKKFMKI